LSASQPKDRIQAVAARHEAVLLAAFPLFLVAVKLARVSNFDPTTAKVVFESANTVDALIGTLFPLVPIALMSIGQTSSVARKS